MIAWNILGWMLVIIVGVICLPIFIILSYAVGYVLGNLLGCVLWYIALLIVTIIIEIFDGIKLIFGKVKSIFVKDNNRDANKQI